MKIKQQDKLTISKKDGIIENLTTRNTKKGQKKE